MYDKAVSFDSYHSLLVLGTNTDSIGNGNLVILAVPSSATFYGKMIEAGIQLDLSSGPLDP